MYNELNNFHNINIQYNKNFNLLRIRCIDINSQFEDLKKVLKILAFKIQSKQIKKDSIILEFLDKDFLNEKIIKVLNILKLTKTLHYFNVIVRKKDLSEDILSERIDFLLNNYQGLNINKKIKIINKGECYMKGYKLLNFDIYSDERGNLSSLSNNQEIPFDIKRIYYTWNMPKNAIRGGHAHKKLEEVMVCLHGSCDFVLDDGEKTMTVTLDRPNLGLYIEAKLWREFKNFSEDCVVMLIASDYYDTSDYVRDYDEFLELRKND